MAQLAPAAEPEAAAPAKKKGGASKIVFRACLFWTGLVVFISIFAPLLPFIDAPDAPLALGDSNKGPGFEHWFGTNASGDDIFSQVAHGGRITLTIAVSAILIGFIIGGFFGITAGYFRGLYEKVIVSLMDTMLAFPPLVLAIALIAFRSPPGEFKVTTPTVIGVLGILAIPTLARITRAATLQLAEREFVTAARTLGASDTRIIVREILPNVIPPMLVFSLLALAVVVVAEGTLAFLGLSVKGDVKSWGFLINDGRQAIEDEWWISLTPTFVMFSFLFAVNYIGDYIRDKFSFQEANI